MTLGSINCGVVTQPLDSVPRHDHMTPSVWGVGHTARRWKQVPAVFILLWSLQSAACVIL